MASSSSKANNNPVSNFPTSFRFPSPYSHFLRLRRRATDKKNNAITLSEQNGQVDIPVIRKRKITVPIYQFDNPYLNETTVWVDARYASLKLVDSGRFGVVISAKDTLNENNNNNKVAIKKVLSCFISPHSTRHILREIRLLKYLSHPNIVQLLNIDVPSSYETWDSVNLVTPLYECNLRYALLNHSDKNPADKKKRILKQLLKALVHMHSKNILHRDVKSLNVLLDKSHENAYFCDLGEARFYDHLGGVEGDSDEKHKHNNDNNNINDAAELTVGPKTILQSAPELFLNEKYDASVDIWGIGCIAAEMFHPKHEYLFNDISARNPMKTVVSILGYPREDEMVHLKKKSSRWYIGLVKKYAGDGNYIRHMFNYDATLADFIIKCLKFSPRDRMTAEQALNHPFLADYTNDIDDEHVGKKDDEDEEKKEAKNMPPDYDFKLSEPPHGLSKMKLKEFVWEEVLSFHPEAAKLR